MRQAATPADTNKPLPTHEGVPTRRAERSTATRGARNLRVGFVMEQVLGHVTWYHNLRGAVTRLRGVDARWVETDLFDGRGVIENIPGVPSFIRAGARARLDVRRGLSGWPCDVLVFNTQKPAMLCQWEMLRIPTLLMTDVTPLQYDRMAKPYDHSADENAAVRFLKHQANIVNFRLAAALLPWSTWVRDSLIQDYGVPPERIYVIPPGVDTERWRPGGDRPITGRVQLLFVGGNFERKGGRLLLDVYRELGLYAHADLHIVTRDQVEPLPGVTIYRNMVNNSPELMKLYQRADVFVLPTLADCFSIASIEAMAAGLPVVTTSTGGIPDIVEPGKTGYLIPPGNAHQLGEVLQFLVNDPMARSRLSRQARERAVMSFDAGRCARRVLQVARGVAASIQTERNGR